MTGRTVYRPPTSSQIPAWILASAFFVIGVLLVADSPSDPGKGGTAGILMGMLAGVAGIALGLWMAAVIVTTSVTATPSGLIVRGSSLRSEKLSWSEVKSFTVEPGRGRMGWPALIIRRTDGGRVVTDIQAFTATHPALVARELTALRAAAWDAPSLDAPVRDAD